ncbi:hypothetical protein DICVIV_00082 [Dictyocaulus viviparus]|uniref:Tetratricopeptide repeat protein n=1 Tax=Dictyocaulus viviparus TaxID=29172 RepID=A0A0D8YC70_DICVI|nr:hypothetical protein DICVIV_00082 [Dictyocaulus viviparus]
MHDFFKPDSPYVIACPASLVDFLRQIDSVKKFGKTYVELKNTLKSISDREARDDPKLEQKFSKENEHCKTSDMIGRNRESFKTSYSVELCPDFHKYYARYITSIKKYVEEAPNDEKLAPRCQQWHKEGRLPGLSEVVNDLKLENLIPDPDYAEILGSYFPDVKKVVSTSSPAYGAILSRLLSHETPAVSAHPYLHLAAAAYWRLIGNLKEALSCYKTAISCVEAVANDDESKNISIDGISISAATLFNKADQPETSIAILEHVFTFNDTSGRPPCVFLKAQATLADAAFLKLDASRSMGIQVEQVADFARIATYFSEPFTKSLVG